MITSKQSSLIGLAALLAIAATQACGGSDDPAPASGGSAPASGGHANASGGTGPVGGSAPLGGSGPSGGSAPLGGFGPAAGGSGPAGGSPSLGGSSSGGSSTGTGGGSAGGSVGKGGSGSGGGSATGATYADVKMIFSSSCTVSKCHDSASGHTNFKDGELYTTLTTALPATPMFEMCKGTTLVTPGDAAGSFLAKIVAGNATCKDSGKDSMVDKMPNKCGTGGTAPMCLTAAQIKTITDWITANAPH